MRQSGVEAAREARRQIEGDERAPYLPTAEFIIVTADSEPGAPVTVFIAWSSNIIERAYPGTAIWQAAIRRFLTLASACDAGERVVRAAAAESLERFPSLDCWLAWCDHGPQV